MGYFKFKEDISTTAKTKKMEPLINTSNIKNESAIYAISNFFYYLNNEQIEELERIYNYSQKVSLKKYKGTINKDSWLKYIVAKGIKITLSKSIEKSAPVINDDNSISTMYGANNNFKKLSFDSIDLYSIKEKYKCQPLFDVEKPKSITYDKNILFLLREGTYENNIELLYMVLDCIFSSNVDYYIKKCELCKRYFFTKRKNTHYCNRKRIVCGKETTCFNSLNFLCEQKEYRYIRNAIKKHLDKYYKKYDYDYINAFKTKSDPIIENCIEVRDVTQEDIDFINKLISS